MKNFIQKINPVKFLKRLSKRTLFLICLIFFFVVAGIVTIVAVSNRGNEPFIYLKFDEGYGTTAYDATSNNNDGTINNATWAQEDECVAGKCLYFDGSGDYVSIPDFDLE